jgi:hypothetical protein
MFILLAKEGRRPVEKLSLKLGKKAREKFHEKAA